MTAIGIDFGTTNSVAAYWDGSQTEIIPIGIPPADWAVRGFDLVMPSIVALDKNGELEYGWPAKLNDTDAKIKAIKRLFQRETMVEAGGHEFYVEEVAANLFHHIKQRVQDNGIDFQSAVITVPANSRGLARWRTKTCAGLGHIEPLALINEPTAAAMAYSKRQQIDNQTILVIDFGGGTLDATLLESRSGMFFEQASAGVAKLGGLDFDERIYNELLKQQPNGTHWNAQEKNQILIEAEKAKIALTDQNEYTIIHPLLANSVQLTRERFNQITRGLVEKTSQSIERVFNDMRIDAGNIDTLLLVGGTSKIPAVRDYIAQQTKTQPAEGIDPMTAVGEGAAIAAAILSGDMPESDFVVSTEHALGLVVYDHSRQNPTFSAIIPRNQKLPAQQKESFQPTEDYQTYAKITVVEGDPDYPIGHEDNIILSEFDIKIDPPRPAADAKFEITYTYDTDGLLHVDAMDRATGTALGVPVTVAFTGQRPPEELVEIAKRVRGQVSKAPEEETKIVQPKKALDDVLLSNIEKTRNKIMPFIESTDADKLEALIQQIFNTEGDTQQHLTDKLAEELHNYTYLW